LTPINIASFRKEKKIRKKNDFTILNPPRKIIALDI